MNDKPIWIDYTNHRGERRWRHIEPRRIYWGSTEWHQQPQWLMHAFDVEKVHDRDFALSGIHEWSDQPPDMHAAPLSNDAIDAIADSIMEPLDSGDAAQDEMERVLMRRFARACIRAASAPAGVHAEPAGDAGMPVVAWLHTVRQNDGECDDEALSFAPDNFPLQGDAPHLFASLRSEPLVRQRDAQAAIAALDAATGAGDR